MFDSVRGVSCTHVCFSSSSLSTDLKELNEWPTFPQLIVKGEFVGGLDVVKEMCVMLDVLVMTHWTNLMATVLG